MAAKPHFGPTPKLSLAQEWTVLGWFRRSPTEFGFPTRLEIAPAWPS
ncbi:MAG: hypothetical protein IRY99_12965 [Isosphaeraceae bacterium]|nr:hypothetical protein [Isosphaeraceae bacterium]